MGYIQWLITIILIAVGLYGSYCQFIIIQHGKEGNRANLWMLGYLFCPECLDEVGKTYRKKIIVSWVIGMAIIIIANQG